MFAHVDADSFFASVLQRKHPHLRGKPLLALGMGGGCVIAASYEAKAKGVKTGMPLREALALYPQAIRLPSDFRETAIASEQIEAILSKQCPLLEETSIDEWFLDLCSCVGGVPADLPTWMHALQQEVSRAVGITVSVGIAPTKLLAKMASEYRKPAGTTIVGHPGSAPGNARPQTARIAVSIENFLRDRPAAAIPGIGRQRQVHARAHAWNTAWDIANAPRDSIVHLFGRPGEEMQRELLGECLHEVIADTAPPKSVSRCRSFRATRTESILWGHVLQHLSYVVLRMRRHGLACSGISVWLRDAQYHHVSQHASLPQLFDTEDQLTPYARRCFRDLHDTHTAYTQAGLTLWNLRPAGTQQFSLFEQPAQTVRDEGLQRSLDALRSRFGKDVVCRAASLDVAGHAHLSIGLPIAETRR